MPAKYGSNQRIKENLGSISVGVGAYVCRIFAIHNEPTKLQYIGLDWSILFHADDNWKSAQKQRETRRTIRMDVITYCVKKLG